MTLCFHRYFGSVLRAIRLGVVALPLSSTFALGQLTPEEEELAQCLQKSAKATAKKANKVLKAFGNDTKKPDPAKLLKKLNDADTKFIADLQKAGGCVAGTVQAQIGANLAAVAAGIIGKGPRLNAVRSPRDVDDTEFALDDPVPQRAIVKGGVGNYTALFYPPDARVPELLVNCGLTHRHPAIEHEELDEDDCDDLAVPCAGLEVHVAFCSPADGPVFELSEAKVVVGWVVCPDPGLVGDAAVTIPATVTGGGTANFIEYRGSATGDHPGEYDIYWSLIPGCFAEESVPFLALPQKPKADLVEDAKLLAPMYPVVTAP